MTDRYSRQILFDKIGVKGQKNILSSSVAIIGCGALGTAQAEALARAGVGRLRLIDRDFVEASNLQRQTMFTESDARDRVPKAVACANHIALINSKVQTEIEVSDFNHANAEQLIYGFDVVLDGSDNFATRYLINDACVKDRINWIYGAAIGAYGVSMTIRPHVTPCLRCIFPEAPAAAGLPTCDTAGIIMPIISVIAAVQVTETLKLITDQVESLHGSIIQFDLWNNDFRRINLGSAQPDCPACGAGTFESLEAENRELAAVLCGRRAVQISPAHPVSLDLSALADRLRSSGETSLNPYLLRFRAGEFELTVFADARTIVSGTDDVTKARTLYARYVGN